MRRQPWSAAGVRQTNSAVFSLQEFDFYAPFWLPSHAVSSAVLLLLLLLMMMIRRLGMLRQALRKDGIHAGLQLLQLQGGRHRLDRRRRVVMQPGLLLRRRGVRSVRSGGGAVCSCAGTIAPAGKGEGRRGVRRGSIAWRTAPVHRFGGGRQRQRALQIARGESALRRGPAVARWRRPAAAVGPHVHLLLQRGRLPQGRMLLHSWRFFLLLLLLLLLLRWRRRRRAQTLLTCDDVCSCGRR